MSGRMKRALRGAAYVAVLLSAIGIVFLASRTGDAPAALASEHNHGAKAAGTDSSRAVSLTADEARRIGVTYAVATVSSLEKEVRAIGQVTYDETSVHTIAPKIDGWVEQLLVNATGQPVAAGQPLLTIYSPMLVQAQEELLLAKQLEADLSGGSADARRSAGDLVLSARRRLDYWDISPGEIAEVERTGRVRKTLTLRSAVHGFVLEKKVLAGQKIMAGDPLFTVADLRTVWVEAEVFEQDLATVRVGLTVHADFEALPGEHRMGRVAYVHPTISPDTRTTKVRVILPNNDLRFKPGMYATLRIVGVRRPGVVTVVRGAVLSTGERHLVFVRAANGHLAPREVVVGATVAERVEILRGLAAGETVVASATFLVDAESNLKTALGGMGNMPGMEVTTPPKPLPMNDARRGVPVPIAPKPAGGPPGAR